MRCTKCVLSDSFPGVQFDENGVCNHCRHEDGQKEMDFDTARKKMVDYFDGIRGKYPYDAIVCYSGGKDSTYTLKLAVEKYKLKVLAYTFDNNFLSGLAKENINTIVGKLGVDHLFFRASTGTFNKFYKFSATESVYSKRSQLGVSDICQTCVNFINLKAVQLAIQQNIPAVIAGFTLGQIPKNSVMYEFKYSAIQEFREDQNNKIIAGMGKEIKPYLYLSEQEADREGFPYYINILAVEPIKEHEIIEAIKAIGWKEPEGLDGCSSNCRLNSFANYVAIYKNHFHPYEKELSYLVRRGLMGREDAIAKLKNPGSDKESREIFKALDYEDKEIDKIVDYVRTWKSQ